MDNNSLGVLTTIGIDFLGGIFLLLGWLCFRKYRGDKMTVRATQARDALTKTNRLFKEDSLDPNRRTETSPA